MAKTKTNLYTQGRGAGFTQPNTPTPTLTPAPTPTPTTPGQAGFDVYGGAFAGRDNAKTYGAFWDKYGQYTGNPMVQSGQSIFNSAGQNANMAGNVFNFAQGNQGPFASANSIFSGIGANGIDFGNGLLQQAGAYDPMAAASERFGVLESMQNPYRLQAGQSLLQSLFSKGQLGGAGNNNIANRSLMSYGAGVENQQQQNLLNAIQSSEGTQNNMYNQGMGMAGLGINLGGAFGNLGQAQQGGMLSALGTQQGAYNLQGLMPNIYNNLLQSSQNWGQQWQQNRAAQDSGGLGGALGTLGGAFLGGMAGPIGSSIGANIGGSLFGGGGSGGSGSMSPNYSMNTGDNSWLRY